ncbi:7 transmembrane receptor (Secretin family) [Popillia japonica]|uniref:7 transmembrane receptor (Secretin family) n=1 Tax=Popillia japonica TaxID=7064 RepID=A0AAW1L909_POPJA
MYNLFPDVIHLVVGNDRCTFENNISKDMYGYLFHFAMPCAIILFINLIIFIKTITYIFQVKNEIRRIKGIDSNVKQKRWKSFDGDKEKIAMAIRIFLLMGINWLFETISSIVDFQKHPSLSTVETIFDIINASQGIFIFCIFMLKKKILKSLMKILNIKMKNRRISVATCSTEVVMLPTSARNSATLLKSKKVEN